MYAHNNHLVFNIRKEFKVDIADELISRNIKFFTIAEELKNHPDALIRKIIKRLRKLNVPDSQVCYFTDDEISN